MVARSPVGSFLRLDHLVISQELPGGAEEHPAYVTIPESFGA